MSPQPPKPPPPPPPPSLRGVDPDRAVPGASIVLSGENLGSASVVPTVTFSAPEHSFDVKPEDWAADRVTVAVPPLDAMGTGGPVYVSVMVEDRPSNAVELLLLEPAPPVTTMLSPDRGLEHAGVRITGTGFGRHHPGTSEVTVDGDAGSTLATVVDGGWSPTQVDVTLPSLEALGGPGPHTVTVHTGWGPTVPHPFLVGKRPLITDFDPDSPAPGALLTISGEAFGAEDAPGRGLRMRTVLDDPDAGVPPAFDRDPVVETWNDTTIIARVPDYRITGVKEVVVTSEWGDGSKTLSVTSDRSSITAWTRLEPHARTDDHELALALGLQARVHDPLWLLGRQWQLREFDGDDAGSPVTVDVEVECRALDRWQPAGGSFAARPAGVPLETTVERERVLPTDDLPLHDLRLAAEIGLDFLRLLESHLEPGSRLVTALRDAYLGEYPLPAPPDTSTRDAGTRAFLSVVTGRAPDGGRLYLDLRSALPASEGGTSTLPATPPIDPEHRDAVRAAAIEWSHACDALFSQPSTPEPPAWLAERMEYAFAVSAGDDVLVAGEHTGGELDWYAFTLQETDDAAAPPSGQHAALRRTAVPAPVSFPGMPAPRWWEMEDARSDFGAVAAGPSELLKLLFLNFASLYGNDWFLVPVDGVPVGSLARITQARVTDSFGVPQDLTAFAGGAGPDWRMFELAGAAGDNRDALLVPDALPTTLQSSPQEEVILLRDELANMAWAVEHLVPGLSGRPLDRLEASLRDGDDQDGAPTHGPLRYALATVVPEHWIPLVPSDVTADDALIARMLKRAAFRDAETGDPILPVGRLLRPGMPLAVFDEEVPRAGARLTRVWELARGTDGTAHLWRSRHKQPGRGEGSSGLRFDTIARSP